MRELVTTESGRLSNSKLWSLVGCAVATWIVIMLTIKDKMTWEIFLAYLGTVGGFSQISKWLAYRYGIKPDDKQNKTTTIAKCSNCPTEEQPGD